MSRRPLEIVFVHLDLGIGGAEQLVLSLAQASLEAGQTVHLVTTNCRQNHCFSLVKQPNGLLCNNVYIWGNWIPTCILQMGTALCSSIRLLYLAFWVSYKFPNADVCVLDVLSTPIPLLLPYTSVLFYCHFPDKLLVRDTVNGEIVEGTTTERSVWKRLYRTILDTVEETTMSLADLLVVNSNFTKETIQQTFPSLYQKPMRVLYPALQSTLEQTTTTTTLPKSSTSPIVSLNRYERKKNIELLLQAYALLQQQQQQQDLPPLIIAGGYDTHNVENVEYRAELEQLAKQQQQQQLGILNKVTFLQSISDETRSSLLREALCVVYTPHLEHFGIVPLESMMAGTPVVAVASGGPKETVIDGKTGFLCESTPQAFCEALSKFVSNPALATQMGQAGRDHVVEKFSLQKFQQKWIQLVEQAVQNGTLRRTTYSYTLWKTLFHVVEAMLVLVGVLLLTYVLRRVGILEEHAHIVGSIKRALLHRDDEL